MSVHVFLGPTLAVAEAADILDATFLPPVRLGDVYRVVSRHRPRAIGIVDGYFQWVPAVRHKEILWAIDQGVHVFGAASMGALRAAELAPFGMHGVGRIFEAYRAGRLDGIDDNPVEDDPVEDDPFEDDPFEDDDEVAVVHGPPESGYRGASESMVNIRCSLALAAREGILADATRRALLAEAKAAFFPDRGYAPLLAWGRANGLPEREMTALERWLPSGRVDQKRLDAVAMLSAMSDFLASEPPPGRADLTFERTTYWERTEAAFRAAAETPAASVLAALRLQETDCERLDADELRDWYFAHVAGTPVPADLDGWMRDAGYTDPGTFHRDVFVEYLRRAPDPGYRP